MENQDRSHVSYRRQAPRDVSGCFSCAAFVGRFPEPFQIRVRIIDVWIFQNVFGTYRSLRPLDAPSTSGDQERMV